MGKQIVRYRFMTIPGKLVGDLRITIDERGAEYSSSFDGGRSTNISIFPVINIQIVRPSEVDANGNRVRSPWNPNDSIGLTKFNLPVFLQELKGIDTDMKTPDLYTYHGSRLELNDKLSDRIRRVFILGTTTLEMVPVIIDQNDERLEGIKIKFNNEQSSVALTLNELAATIYNIEHLDVDVLSLQLYNSHVTKSRYGNKSFSSNSAPASNGLADIAPKDFVE